MKTLEEIIDGFDEKDLEEFQEVIAHAERRHGGLEGIAGFIGLVDLREEGVPMYQAAPMDMELSGALASDAMLLIWLYSQMEQDEHYPSAGRGFGALAEKCFGMDAEGKPIQYREVLGLK